jgi:hypothetical protein
LGTKKKFGETNTYFLFSDDNSLWGCGWNEYNQLSMGCGVSQVSVMTRLSVPEHVKNCPIVKLFAEHWNSGILVQS